MQEADDLLSIKDHFRPRFMAREFLLGAQYMIRLWWLLMVASLIARNIALTLLPTLPNVVSWAQLTDAAYRHNIFYRLEMSSKQHFWKQFAQSCRASKPQGIILDGIQLVVAPVTEELAYRGLGHAVGYAANWAGLYAFAWICAQSTLAGAIWICAGLLSAMAELMMVGVGDVSMTMNMVPTIARSIMFALILPAQLGLLQTAARNQPKRNSTNTASNHHNEEAVNGPSRISRLVRGNDSSDSETLENKELETTIDRSLNWTTRWFGSFCFGAAHLPYGQQGLSERLTMSSTAQYSYLQKFMGTLASSFLVESRLVVHRRTLWGAIGAHVAFNTIGVVFTSLHPRNNLVAYKLFYTKSTVKTLSVISYVGLVLFFWQQLLNRVANALGRLEEHLS
jgi:membrane protease YdiL (CAAX protease family)